MNSHCVNFLQAGGHPVRVARFVEALRVPEGVRAEALLPNLVPCPAHLAGTEQASAWALARWGTPWGDVGTRSTHLPGETVARVRFLTAGRAALPGLQEVSRRVPGLAFIYSVWTPRSGLATCAALLEGVRVAELTELCGPSAAEHGLELDTRDDPLACHDWRAQRTLARLEDAAISMLPPRARMAFVLPPRPARVAAA